MALQVKIRNDVKKQNESKDQHRDSLDDLPKIEFKKEIDVITKENNIIKKVSKEAYLDFCDYHNGNSWVNYSLWSSLSQKEKTWWEDYTQDIYDRYIIAKYI